jgi:hypothetical protein
VSVEQSLSSAQIFSLVVFTLGYVNWHQLIIENLDITLGEESLFEAYRGKRVILLGGSSFIGK